MTTVRTISLPFNDKKSIGFGKSGEAIVGLARAALSKQLVKFSTNELCEVQFGENYSQRSQALLAQLDGKKIELVVINSSRIVSGHIEAESTSEGVKQHIEFDAKIHQLKVVLCLEDGKQYALALNIKTTRMN